MKEIYRGTIKYLTSAFKFTQFVKVQKLILKAPINLEEVQKYISVHIESALICISLNVLIK